MNIIPDPSCPAAAPVPTPLRRPWLVAVAAWAVVRLIEAAAGYRLGQRQAAEYHKLITQVDQGVATLGDLFDEAEALRHIAEKIRDNDRADQILDELRAVRASVEQLGAPRGGAR